MDKQGFTTSPIHSDAETGLRPEWLRMADAVRYSGISRSLLYELIQEARIDSRVLRKRGRTRGIRLISVDSINQFIRSLPSGDEASPSQTTTNH